MDRKRLAADIINNPLWGETIEALGRYYYEGFRQAKSLEDRNRIALANDILDDFQSFLELALQEGITDVGDNNE